MNVEGFVLIETELGTARSVASRVAELDGVLQTETVTGPYDVLARVRRSCERELVHCLEEEILAIPAVTRALVCPLASFEPIWQPGSEPILDRALSHV